MKRLREFEPVLREVIASLNRRNLSDERRSAFVRQGSQAHEQLLQIAQNEEVADLPRCNALDLLFQLQFSGPDLEELRQRDRGPLIATVVTLLGSPRDAVRAASATILGRFLDVSTLSVRHAWIDRRTIREVLSTTLAEGKLPKGAREYVERILEKAR